MASKVVSILNPKGGVGKSTLAMMLAEYMTFVHRKKALLIDLDSQANLMEATRLYGQPFKGYGPYDAKRFRPFDCWVPDAEDLRKLGHFEVEIDVPSWKFGPKPGYFDTAERKWGGWNRAEGTNPSGYALDRTHLEGTKYQLSLRLGSLTREFMQRVGIP